MSSPSIESLLKTTREQLTLLTKSTTPNLSPLPIPPSPDIEDLFLRNLGLSSAVGSIVHGEQLKEVLIDRLRAIQAEIAAAKPEPEIEPEQQPPPSSHSTSFSSSSSSDLEVSFKPPPPPSQTTTALETETLFQLSASTFFSHVNAASLALSNNDSDETPDFLACARNIKLAEQQREAAMRCSETCTDNNDDNDDILQVSESSECVEPAAVGNFTWAILRRYTLKLLEGLVITPFLVFSFGVAVQMTMTGHRVQFIASKTSIRWSCG